MTLIFNPTADAYVRSDLPTTNYGRAVSLVVDATPDTQSYLRFALEGVNGTVTNATLRLFGVSGSAAGYRMHSLTGAWDEEALPMRRDP